MKRAAPGSSQPNRKKLEMVEESDMDEKDETKRRSRNLSEKKRRDQFNMLINELCSMVSTTARKMDKSTVLRSTIAFLKTHNELSVQSQSHEIQENWKPSFLSNEEFTHLMLEALDGFVIVFAYNGRILYLSESVTSLLGYFPHDLKTSIFELIHESDRPAVCKLLNTSTSQDSQQSESNHESYVSIAVHMKRGSIFSSSSASYELVKLTGIFHHWAGSTVDGSVEWRPCFVAMARLQSPQLLRETILRDGSKNEFTSRHSLEWKFLFLDHRAPPIIGYLPFEVLGTSGYDYYHVDDLEKVAACHETLMQTGEGTSCHYRFLTKGQQWIWLQTRYYITYHQWNSKPEFIVCTHTVISYEQVEADNKKAQTTKTASSEKAVERTKVNKSPGDNSNVVNSQSSCPSPALSISSRESSPSSLSEKSAGTSVTHTMPAVCSQQDGSNSTDFMEKVSSFSKIGSTASQDAPSDGIADSDSVRSATTSVSKQTSSLRTPAPSLVHTGVPLPSTAQPSLVTIVGLPQAPVIPAAAVQENQTVGPQVAPTVVMTPNPSQFQDYLRRRHQLLQQQILMQQEELKRVSEQLMLVQFMSPSIAVTSGGPSVYTVSMPTGTSVSAGPSDILIHHAQSVTQQTSQREEHPANLSASTTSHSTPHHSVTTSSHFHSPSDRGVQLISQPSPIFSLQLPQEHAQVIFTQGFTSQTPSDPHLGNT